MVRHRQPLRCASLIGAALLASCAASDPPADFEDVARSDGDAAFALTDVGILRGTQSETMRVWKGVPYAAAPIGALRWQPPQRAAPAPGVRDATSFAGHCAQTAGPFGLASASEDCLFLNVFAPRRLDDRRGLRPVMVWIHGGGLVSGESDDFDPTPLVDQGDVIVVTVNYRLGVLGFLAHPALTAESPDHASGNYGLMDQQAALHWVRRNILAFGGDPHNVTIFGESAGALSVHTQLASPGSRGLFQRAIVESGAYELTQPTLATAEADGTAFANRAGCPDQTAACLRGLSVAQVLAAQLPEPIGAFPVVDNKFLTQSVGAAFATGQFNRVPIMEGSNHDEWRLFVALTELATGAPLAAADYPAAIQATLGVAPEAVPLFASQYPLASFASPSLALSALGTDGFFDCNARTVDQAVAQFVPTFAYELNDPNPPQLFLPPVSFPYGAAHASEIQFLFNLRPNVPAPALDADQQKLAAAMVSYWTTFARTGQPSSAATPAWPAFDGAIVQSLVGPRPGSETDFATEHNCAFWDSLRQ